VTQRLHVSVSTPARPGPVRCVRTVIRLAVVALFMASCSTGSQGGTGTVALPDKPPGIPSTPAHLVHATDPRAYYHFILGYQAEIEKDTERAIHEYSTALRGDPGSTVLKARLASLYFSIGEVVKAVRFADRVSESEVQDAATLVQMAGIFAGAGQTDKALLYDRAIAQQPTGTDAYFSKGLLLVNLKRLDEAEASFKKGMGQAKDSPLGYYYLGRVAVEAKHYEQAISSFERAMAINQSFEPAYIALAAVYELQQQHGNAVGVYRKYLSVVNPNNRDVRQHLIRLYITDKAYAEALAELDIALAQDPDDLDAQLRVGLIYGELKDYPRAIAQLNKILAVRPGELRVRDYLGLMYEETKDYPRAIAAYEHNLTLQPAYIDGHMHMGFLQYRLKHYPEAVAHFSEAVKLNPRQPDVHLLLGLTYLQTEQYVKASQVLEEGIRYNPGNPDLHFNLGTAYDKLDRFDEVVKAMEATLRLDPHHADALNYLGYSYTERGMKIEEALSLIKRAVSLKPNNGYYVDSLGWAFFKLGQVDHALAEMKRAASLVHDDPVIYEHLGEIFLKQNQMAEAREAWLHSLELDPTNLKLIERFRAQGLGDATSDERVRQAKRRVSAERADTPKAVP